MIAAALSFILSPVGRYVAIGLVVMAALGGIYVKGRTDGANRIQTKWDAAKQAAIERGEAARSNAESAVERDPVGRVPNDKFDRDSRPM